MYWFATLLCCLMIFESSALQAHILRDPTKQSCLLLVTGCGRSGTNYISELLTECGLDILHEIPGKDGCSSWFMAVDIDSYYAVSPKNFYFRHIFHQVRNPLDVISSWYWNARSVDPRVWSFIYRSVPAIKPHDPLLARLAKYWYYWNLHAEKKAEWRYCIEDIDVVLPKMAKRLGVELDITALERVPRDVNTRHPVEKRITWAELQSNLTEGDFMRLQSLAKKYGYPITD